MSLRTTLILFAIVFPAWCQSQNFTSKIPDEYLAHQSKDSSYILFLNENWQRITGDDQQQLFALANEMNALSHDLHFEKGESLSKLRLADALLMMSNEDSAQKILNGLKSVSGVQSILPDIMLMQGKIFFQRSEYDSPVSYYFKCMIEADKQGSNLFIIKAKNNLGNLYQLTNEADTALTYHRQVLQLAHQKNDNDMVALAQQNMGVDFEMMEKYDSSKKYLEDALNIYQSLNDEKGMADVYNDLGLVLKDEKNYDNAIASFLQAMDIRKKIDDRKGQVSVAINLGSAYNKKEMYDEALSVYLPALHLADSLQLREKKKSLYRNIANVYSSMKNYEKALDYFKSYTSLKDSLFNEAKSRSIADMQTKYETEKKDEQIKIQNAEIKTKEFQRNALFAGAIGLLLLLIAGTYVFVQRQQLAKRNQKIAYQKIDEVLKDQELKTYNTIMQTQEEERKRIADDLHDRLGSMLATVKMLFASVEEKVDKYQLKNVQQYEKANSLLDEACDEVRKIAHNLSTSLLMQFGLQSAMRDLMETIESGGMKTKLLMYGMDERLDQQMEIGVYRIVQECVSNVLKHAHANTITIQLNKSKQLLAVTIEDDGQGFDLNEKMKSGGMGLKNIQARAEKLGGNANFDSTPGRGTTVFVEIPVE